ncbi:MAG: hypothetical protein ABSG49_06765, partial [Methanoregula sp.]|uniref:hypothetical protein n=1 Tax=Methanoregula sp. TaxID=2052170 RepID=UPI003C14137E
SAFQNTTIYFTLTGTGFPTGSDMTTVNFTKGSYFERNVTINSVTATSINGTLAINKTAPFGKWNVNVQTVDGTMSNTMAGALIINNVSTPAITAIKPVSAFQNTTIYFTLTGTGFPTGSDMTTVNFTKGSYFERNVTINSVTATSINGTLAINKTAPFGQWNVNVQTVDGTMSNTMAKAFTVNNVSTPAITAIQPVSAIRNTTIYFTLTGTGFPTGSDMTTVNFTQGTYFDRNVTINSVTATSINGTLFINSTAPLGKWNVNVQTVDGTMSNTLANVFTIGNYPAPIFGAITPVSGYKNATVSFTVTGKNFQTKGTNVTFWNKSGSIVSVLVPTIFSVSPTQVVGSVDIPNPVYANDSYRVNITTVDGGWVSQDKAFKVLPLPKAQITGFIPSTIQAGTTVPYTLNGNYFQQRKGTFVYFTNATGGTVIQATVNSAYMTRILGAVTVPAGSPAGVWSINVTTADAGWTNQTKAFSSY